MDVLLLNGPNLNLLGSREPDYYGTQTLDDITSNLTKIANNVGLTFEHHQDNSEAKLIKYIHNAVDNGVQYIIINPAAFTHTSIALRDAILAVGIEFSEVHLSNIYKRENFRKQSYFSDIAQGIISGFGPQGYEFALQAAIQHIQQLERL
ncbi:type II 3-dehydroquinate dehydratase [Candidatus Vesicomyidisocius calyptogenae]|uniref:3-dehydroquinate dehydratase n=1 Tax=Vesicomyosocius okutanii subsp. Calyptogena okutanii (strain HA) TaxID=412965 RepID=AROQ_VESOH|nr:type II 3-dehydroquinate dehydratase [Candidatus Vesicomyosocius okutanii]A5CVG7.1 RecName: Full=3-dehydroquinate dehydratase; Short=3-dehydroquinase; AltName: Full=Type II DHQase [Candidatus Vesicomyosocius okutanii]BAF62056.1 3-dehydroquinate dehydratase II [Candidatus Vesicomyosocius okutanii]